MVLEAIPATKVLLEREAGQSLVEETGARQRLVRC
jgi:hypothetical protein